MAKTFIPVFYHICRFWQGGKGIPFADFTRSRRARIRGAPSRRRAGALWRVLRAQNARGSFGCKTHAKNRKTALRRSQGVRGGLPRVRTQGGRSVIRCTGVGAEGGGEAGAEKDKTRERICAPFPQAGLPCIPVSAGRGAGRKLPGTLPAKIPYRAGSCSSRTRGRAGRRPRAPS